MAYRSGLGEVRRGGFTLVELPAVSQRKRAAFTLVELLVVVAIIAVLVSILLPAMNRARAQAESVSCMSNLKQIAIAFQMYRNENSDFVTPLGTYYSGSWTVCNGSGGSPSYGSTAAKEIDRRWFNLLFRYTNQYRVFNCPVVTRVGNFAWGPTQMGENTRVFDRRDPAGSPLSWVLIGYSAVGASSNYAHASNNLGWCFMNPSADGDGGGVNYQASWYPALHAAKRYTQVSSMAKQAGTTLTNTIFVMDGVYYVPDYAPSGTPNATHANFKGRYVHPGPRCNTLFGDGHVEGVLYGDVSYANVYPPNGASTFRFIFKR